MGVSVCVCTHVYMWVYVHVCVFMRVHGCVRVCALIVYVWVYVYMCIPVRIRGVGVRVCMLSSKGRVTSGMASERPCLRGGLICMQTAFLEGTRVALGERWVGWQGRWMKGGFSAFPPCLPALCFMPHPRFIFKNASWPLVQAPPCCSSWG